MRKLLTISEVLGRIELALRDIQGSTTFIDFDPSTNGEKPILMIMMVSSKFIGMPPHTRAYWVAETVAKNDPALCNAVNLAFECLTDQEFAQGKNRIVDLH